MLRRLTLFLLSPVLVVTAAVVAQVPRRVTFRQIDCPRVVVPSLPVDTLQATVKPQLLSQLDLTPDGVKEGEFVLLSYPVDVDGRVDLCHVSVLGESSLKWTTAVLSVLDTFRYEPGRLDGVPIKVQVLQRVVY